jgi:hypothetical protein
MRRYPETLTICTLHVVLGLVSVKPAIITFFGARNGNHAYLQCYNPSVKTIHIVDFCFVSGFCTGVMKKNHFQILLFEETFKFIGTINRHTVCNWPQKIKM